MPYPLLAMLKILQGMSHRILAMEIMTLRCTAKEDPDLWREKQNK